MTRVNIITVTAFAAMSVVAPAVCGAQHLTGPHMTGDVPAPVVLDTHGQFQDKFARVGDDVFISGQPTERALRDLRGQGVTTVVNLRTPEEMSSRVPFDEAALVKNLGMEYVYIPVRGNAEFVLARCGEVIRGRDERCEGKSIVALHDCLAGQSHVGRVPDPVSRRAGRDGASAGALNQSDGRHADGWRHAASRGVPRPIAAGGGSP